MKSESTALAKAPSDRPISLAELEALPLMQESMEEANKIIESVMLKDARDYHRDQFKRIVQESVKHCTVLQMEKVISSIRCVVRELYLECLDSDFFYYRKGDPILLLEKFFWYLSYFREGLYWHPLFKWTKESFKLLESIIPGLSKNVLFIIFEYSNHDIAVQFLERKRNKGFSPIWLLSNISAFPPLLKEEIESSLAINFSMFSAVYSQSGMLIIICQSSFQYFRYRDEIARLGNEEKIVFENQENFIVDDFSPDDVCARKSDIRILCNFKRSRGIFEYIVILHTERGWRVGVNLLFNHQLVYSPLRTFFYRQTASKLRNYDLPQIFAMIAFYRANMTQRNTQKKSILSLLPEITRFLYGAKRKLHDERDIRHSRHFEVLANDDVMHESEYNCFTNDWTFLFNVARHFKHFQIAVDVSKKVHAAIPYRKLINFHIQSHTQCADLLMKGINLDEKCSVSSLNHRNDVLNWRFGEVRYFLTQAQMTQCVFGFLGRVAFAEAWQYLDRLIAYLRHYQANNLHFSTVARTCANAPLHDYARKEGDLTDLDIKKITLHFVLQANPYIFEGNEKTALDVAYEYKARKAIDLISQAHAKNLRDFLRELKNYFPTAAASTFFSVGKKYKIQTLCEQMPQELEQKFTDDKKNVPDVRAYEKQVCDSLCDYAYELLKDNQKILLKRLMKFLGDEWGRGNIRSDFYAVLGKFVLSQPSWLEMMPPAPAQPAPATTPMPSGSAATAAASSSANASKDSKHVVVADSSIEDEMMNLAIAASMDDSKAKKSTQEKKSSAGAAAPTIFVHGDWDTDYKDTDHQNELDFAGTYDAAAGATPFVDDEEPPATAATAAATATTAEDKARKNDSLRAARMRYFQNHKNSNQQSTAATASVQTTSSSTLINSEMAGAKSGR